MVFHSSANVFEKALESMRLSGAKAEEQHLDADVEVPAHKDMES